MMYKARKMEQRSASDGDGGSEDKVEVNGDDLECKSATPSESPRGDGRYLIRNIGLMRNARGLEQPCGI